MTFKSGFYPGEGQVSVPNPVRQKVLSKFTHTFKKGKPLVGKGTIKSLFGSYFGRLGSFFSEGTNAAFDFKPCKLCCKTEVSQNVRGNGFAIKWPLLVAVTF